MSGRGGRGIGLGTRFLESDSETEESEEESEEEGEIPENCPTCNQPMNLSAEKAQFLAKLPDQCVPAALAGGCGLRKRVPGRECC